jgi:hypothetical protein
MVAKPITITALAFLTTFTAAVAEPLSAGEEESFSEKCSEAIQQRLAAPSTFALIEVELLQRKPATYAAMWGLDNQEKHLLYLMQSAEVRAVTDAMLPKDYDVLSGYFHYDASNEYGVPLRHLAFCSVSVRKSEEYGLNPLIDADVMIDGFTYSDWLQAEIYRLAP